MKTVVFDVDDTLYDQIEPFRKAIEVSFSSNVLIKGDISLEKLYKKFRFFSDLVFPKTVDGSLSLNDMRVFRITEAFKYFDYKITLEEAEMFQKKYQLYQGEIELLEEMRELLTQLSEQDIQLGILTNGPTNHQKSKIKQLGIETFIPEANRFISEEVGIAKPNIAVFKLIEENLSVTANELIYIGDSYENDVIGAKNAGWKCVWLNKYQKELTSEDILPDKELRNCRELSQVLSSMLSE